MMNKIMVRIHSLSDWCMRLAYVNLLWFVFTILGLVIFGMGPSTTAMFAVIRKWQMDGLETPIFKTFWHSYKTEFKKANLLFLLLFAVGYTLFFDFRFLLQMEGWQFTMLAVLVASILFVFTFTVFFIYPMFVHYNLKIAQYIKYSFLLVISHPIQIVLMAVSLALIAFMFILLPAMIFFYSGSLICLIITKFTWKVFEKVDYTQSLVTHEA